MEDGNTVSDYEAEEIRRKVSINTSVIPVEWQDTKINFLDTPGYFDFAAEVKLAMNVADTGLIMVSAKSGVEVGTEKAWEYCFWEIQELISFNPDLTSSSLSVLAGFRISLRIILSGWK